MRRFIVSVAVVAALVFTSVALAVGGLSGRVTYCGTSTGVNGVTVYIHNYTTGAQGATTTHSEYNSPGYYSFWGIVAGDTYQVWDPIGSHVWFVGTGGIQQINLCQ